MYFVHVVLVVNAEKYLWFWGEAILVTLGEKHFLCLLFSEIVFIFFCVCV